jgi:hypothetical protein
MFIWVGFVITISRVRVRVAGRERERKTRKRRGRRRGQGCWMFSLHLFVRRRFAGVRLVFLLRAATHPEHFPDSSFPNDVERTWLLSSSPCASFFFSFSFSFTAH